jgi:molecular chaperone IbpA
MSNFARHVIGYDWLLNIPTDNQDSYPPHDIDSLSETHYRLTLAVAGFRRENIMITTKDGYLNVAGTFLSKEERAAKERDVLNGKTLNPTAPKSLHKGIAFRNFNRQFKIGPDVEIINASLENGLLVIDMERQLPEAKTLKTIPIR